MPSQGNQLQLSFGVNVPESRAIHKDATLPDNSPVGVKLDGYADYANLVYKGTTTGGTQAWALTEGSITLTDTKGTIYAYWPYSSTTSIDAIDVDMTAADQTDWLYATPVTGICEDKAEAAVTMNHAAANINVTINKGTYLGSGAISNITVQSDGIALGGTFNAAKAEPGYEAFEDEGKPLSRDLSTTTGAATDIMVVPTGTSAAITFTATIDGIQFTATSSAMKLEKGNSYVYTLNLSDISTYMTVGSFGVTPWTTINKENLNLITKVQDPYIENGWMKLTFDVSKIVYNTQICSSRTSIDVGIIEGMIIDGLEITPVKNYRFTETGIHTIYIKLKDPTHLPDDLFDDCEYLSEIVLPDIVTSIGDGVFAECYNLCEITSLATVAPLIDGDMFDELTAYSGVVYYPKGADYSSWDSVKDNYWSVIEIGSVSVNGIYYSANGKTVLGNDYSSQVEVIIKEGVTTISTSAFENWTDVKKIVIPNSVTTIGDYAFAGCDELTEVTIGSGVQTIGEAAFRYCSSLLTINSLATTVPTVEDWTFNSIKSNGTLIVPKGCMDAYASWMSTSSNYLGYYGWTIQEADN